MSTRPYRHLELTKYAKYIAENLAMVASLAVDGPARHFFPQHIMKDKLDYRPDHAVVKCYRNHQLFYKFECLYTKEEWWVVDPREYEKAAYEMLGNLLRSPQITLESIDLPEIIDMTYRRVQDYVPAALRRKSD